MRPQHIQWAELMIRRIEAAEDRLKLSAETMCLVVLGEAKMEHFGPQLQTEIDQIISRVLPLLDPHCRRVIELRLRGHTFDALAAMIGCSTVKAEREVRRAADWFVEALSRGTPP